MATGAAAVVLLSGAFAAPATALAVPASNAAETSSNLKVDGLYGYADGQYNLIQEVPAGKTSANDNDDVVTPNLLDPWQWSQCWVVNDANFVIKTYNRPWNGNTEQITLKCGNTSFGYKHVARPTADGGHQEDWQNILDGITPPGTEPSVSWDDLMSAGIAAALDWSEVVVNQSGNKTCVIGTMAWVVNGQIHSTYRLRVVWSNNNMHVITAFPQSSGSCPSS
jgi:hypothetical protein